MKWKIGNVEIKNQVVLAPMAGVTNYAFRSIAKEAGVGLLYSEMISTMGIMYGSKKTIDLLKITDEERPISVQIFGHDLKSFLISAKYIEENIKPDIIDINMGCPVPKIALKSQAGSALLKNPEKVYEIVHSVCNQVKIPVTVKIRSGWDEKNINAIEIAKLCEKAGAKAICIHARTRNQGYSGKANWEIIKQVKQNVSIPVIGNGDITSPEIAKQMLEQTKCDAVMIGRAALGNPWLLEQCVKYLDNEIITKLPTKQEKIDMIKKHYQLLKKSTSEKQSLLEIRTHALWYLKGLKNSSEIKRQIVTIKTEEELFNILDNYNY